MSVIKVLLRSGLYAVCYMCLRYIARRVVRRLKIDWVVVMSKGQLDWYSKASLEERIEFLKLHPSPYKDRL